MAAWSTFPKLSRERRASAALEYNLVAAMTSVIILGAYFDYGNHLAHLFASINSQLAQAGRNLVHAFYR